MSGGRWRNFGLPAGSRKDRDDDLMLFSEMFRREKEQNFSLHQLVSDELKPNNGKHPPDKIQVGKKGFGQDFIVAESEKNDYNWLKTPPPTPLFPSLETFPLAEKLEESKANHKQNSPNKKSAASLSSVTPTTRTSSSSAKARNTTGTLNHTKKSYQASTDYSRRMISATDTTKLVNPKENSVNSALPNTPKKNSDSKKPRSQGVSPQVRPRIPATIPRFPDEAPPNLITTKAVIAGRPFSVSRGRPGNTALARVETEFRQDTQQNAASNEKIQSGNMVLGSRMVEKLMNARRGDNRNDQKPSYQTAANKMPGFGRLMSKSPLDMGLKNTEMKRTSADLQQNMGSSKISTATGSS